MYFIPKQMMSTQTGFSSLIVKDFPRRYVNRQSCLVLSMNSEKLPLPSPQRGTLENKKYVFCLFWIDRALGPGFRLFLSMTPHTLTATPRSRHQSRVPPSVSKLRHRKHQVSCQRKVANGQVEFQPRVHALGEAPLRKGY